MLSVTDFLAHVLNDLGLPSATRTKGESLSHLNNYLLVRSRRGAITALIVDEAQLLSWELLEEIRLLTNLETSQHKLLQIVLVGQPELDRRLDSQELRQLKQRIGLRCHLEPLGLEQVRGYIHRRLEVAGANSHRTTIFPEHTIDAIYKFSGGIPRLVNTLCENSLVAGYGRQVRTITPEIVQEIAEDFRLNLVTEMSAAGSNILEERKKVLMTLFRMIEEVGGISEEHLRRVQIGVRSESTMSRYYDALRRLEREQRKTTGGRRPGGPRHPTGRIAGRALDRAS